MENMKISHLNSIIKHKALSGTELLVEFKNSPLGFIDVGARGGIHNIVEPFAMYTSVLAFEPDHEECDRLNKIPEVFEHWSEFILEPKALSDKKGQAELVLLSAATNHSLREPNLPITRRYGMEKWQEIGRESLETETLDNIIFQKYQDKPYIGEFIKLDTQGSEYEIIMGARKTISERTVAVVCEVSFAELYKGQKLFSEVEILMRELGFSFYGFTSMFSRSQKQLNKLHHGTKERPFYTDAIFFKDPLTDDSLRESFSNRQSKSLLLCAILLGYYDFALELAKSIWLFESDQKEMVAIEEFIKDISIININDSISEVKVLHEKVLKEPKSTNLYVGAFVDQRRGNNDFHDVLNTLATPQPK
jgi:FkbM family methyltransferase